jgi:hypothetical protein
MGKMRRGPFHKSFHVVGDRARRWIVNLPEDRIEHRPRLCCQIGHELTEFAVEVAKEQQSSAAQNCEPRIVNAADGILCLE